ncbi:MAG: SIMPL domain-containing protein [Patescibacteria group bacterium]|nr:SIMPL domain-containing protein [Patescibacteria group bacterium]
MDDKNLVHDLFYNAGLRVAVIGVLAILALFLVAETVAVAQDFGRPGNPATDVITVTGDGQATVAPDVAHISFTVQNTAPQVADAQAATTKQANAVIDWVKGQGIADKDITTLSYAITPQYSYRNCPAGALCPIGTPTVTGYQVAETVQVTVRDLANVGALVGGLGGHGVQNVSGPDFALDNPAAGYDAARSDAIAKAKAQAASLAAELGVRLGKIVNFSEAANTSPMPVYSMAAGAPAAKAETPNVPAGENTYNASVSITYEIR